MALTTGAARQAACSSCRQSVLRSFIASIGGSSTPLPQRRTFAASTRRWNRTQGGEHALNDIHSSHSPSNEGMTVDRRYAQTKTRAKDANDIVVTGEQLQEMQELDEAIAEEAAQAKATRRAEHMARRADQEVVEETTQASAPSEGEHVPWYLQVQSPFQPTESTLSARQKIPDLPEHSPTLLEPLLKQVSIDLGMDDLTLLDLRELDPPPALGANLFMLIGTARSEKHLHVSADKLCRWLRSEHQLTPVADGLLGRQELKVKLRRRAKRARLMSAVGAKSSNDTELEDGIRTGWVCVNIGMIEGGELPLTEQEIEAEKKIVGFGTRTRGCHVVVQLMTEEKRGDIDLEKLWTGMLNRSRKAKAELLAQEGEAATVEKSEIADSVQEKDRSTAESVPFPDAFEEPIPQPDLRA
ncbi:putative ATPase synthesis protein 25 [Septoria linicola]|nr:putative ATPase synthesis protein 25 [Septoria linicola]